jgi:hypothetical protein
MRQCPDFVPMDVPIVQRKKGSWPIPALLLETELALFA